jgi:acetyl esterase/lipase
MASSPPLILPMRTILPTVAFVALVSFATSASSAMAQRLRPRDVDTLPSRAPDLVASYGADSLQVGELRLPKGQGPFPLVVVIHGGCWTRGYATRRNTAAVASALADEGMATWNVEYRQAGDPGGGWPNSYLDIASAVDHARTLATRYPIDTSHVVVIGHSAGAHLALWAAARHTLPVGSVVRGGNPLRVRAAVAIDGPGDLAGLVGRDAQICGRPVIAPFMGGTPAEVAARYAEGSPLARLPFGAAQYLVSATVLTASEAEAYKAAAQRAGDSVTLLDAPEGGHFGVIAPGTRFWPPVAAFIRQAVGAERR